MSSLDLAFAFGADNSACRHAAFFALAVGVHVAITLGVRVTPAHAAAAILVTEVELAPATPEPPEPEHHDEPAKAPSGASKPAPSAAPPPLARAGALVTAKPTDSPRTSADEPVEFVTDPNGKAYGSGLAAQGGTADHGERGASTLSEAAPARATATLPREGDLVPAANLSRRATLNEANACAGYYPGDATVDSGDVTLRLVVTADGAVSSSSVVSESPAGQGFAAAARTCLRSKRFAPSLDKSGAPVRAATTIKVSFVRR